MRILMITTQTENKKKLIVFDCRYWVTKKFQAVVNELFIRCRKLNISLVLNLIFLFQKMLIKFNTLLNNEDSQQERITKYCN